MKGPEVDNTAASLASGGVAVDVGAGGAGTWQKGAERTWEGAGEVLERVGVGGGGVEGRHGAEEGIVGVRAGVGGVREEQELRGQRAARKTLMSLQASARG